MVADKKWNRVRVASPIEPPSPDQIATDSSMTLAAAKPATAMQRSSSRASRSSSAAAFTTS